MNLNTISLRALVGKANKVLRGFDELGFNRRCLCPTRAKNSVGTHGGELKDDI
jgi:hypothetical protein